MALHAACIFNLDLSLRTIYYVLSLKNMPPPHFPKPAFTDSTAIIVYALAKCYLLLSSFVMWCGVLIYCIRQLICCKPSWVQLTLCCLLVQDAKLKCCTFYICTKTEKYGVKEL